MKTVCTARLLLDRALNKACDQACVDWALAMLKGGKDSPNLRLLAGAIPPYNHFELAQWRDLALGELGIEQLDLDGAILRWARELLQDAIAKDDDALYAAISELEDLCIATNYHRSIYDFYVLHFAREDLLRDNFSAHLPGATRENIGQKIRAAAEKFLKSSIDS